MEWLKSEGAVARVGAYSLVLDGYIVYPVPPFASRIVRQSVSLLEHGLHITGQRWPREVVPPQWLFSFEIAQHELPVPKLHFHEKDPDRNREGNPC